MKKHSLVPVLVLVPFAWLALGWAQTGERAKSSGAVTVKPTASRAANTTAPKPLRKGIDPDEAYKANCTRCHVEPRKFSARQTATIVRHMRVRGNLTEEEANAILRYLTR